MTAQHEAPTDETANATVKKMTLESLETASFWANLSVVVLTALLAIAGGLAWYFSSKLGTMKDEELVRFKLQSDEKIASAHARAVEANQKAEEERLERVKIEKRLADRMLTGRALYILKDFRGQEFESTPYWDDKESRALYDRLVVELHHVGWKIITPVSTQMLFPGVKGVIVYSHPSGSEATRQAASALVAVLVEEGIAAERRDTPSGPKSNIITINIGSKP